MEKRLSLITTMLISFSIIASVMIVRQEKQINTQERVFANAAPSIVSLEDTVVGARGTGFLVRAKSGKRVIVTNAHVCEINPGKPMFAVFHRMEDSLRSPLRFPAIVVKKDGSHDLCIVSVPVDLKAEPLELADEVYSDSHLYIIGYPAINLLSSSDGFVRGYQLVDQEYPLDIKLCVGKKHYTKTVPIEQENGATTKEKRCFLRAKFMFTDALGDHGQSGSPGLNGDGEVVGVMSLITGNARPFAYLVPLESLREFLSSY